MDVTAKQLLRVHTRAHLNRLNDAFARARLFRKAKLDSDTIASPGSRAAVLRAAGLVVRAVDDLLGAEAAGNGSASRRAFVMVRPPGHHAERGSPQGFCFVNNVLVGVAHAQARAPHTHRSPTYTSRGAPVLGRGDAASSRHAHHLSPPQPQAVHGVGCAAIRGSAASWNLPGSWSALLLQARGHPRL